MRYRKLGRWGVEVSEVSLGSWLTYGGSVVEDAATDCVRRAYELGVNFFDTANAYMRGAAEEVMGRAVGGFRRESFVLATKVYLPMSNRPNDHGLSRKHVFEQCHASLRRLDVDYVDLYQCHRYDEAVPLEETCSVMNDLIRQGKVLYWGVSEWTAPQISAAVELCREQGWSVPVSNQPQYNALHRGIETDVLPTSERLGLGNVVWSPLAQGILTGKYTDATAAPAGTRAATDDAFFMASFMRQDVLDAVQELRPIAQEAGATLGQLALAWCLRKPGVSSVIIGATRASQVDENVAAADLDLAPEVFTAMDAILLPVMPS